MKTELQKRNIDEVIEMSTQEKISLYADYFKGRDDVYPYLSIDKSNPNKKYYIPACINEWKQGVCNKTMGKPCRNCQYRENKPLTIDIIKRHIYNNQTIGIYPMLDDEISVMNNRVRVSLTYLKKKGIIYNSGSDAKSLWKLK